MPYLTYKSLMNLIVRYVYLMLLLVLSACSTTIQVHSEPPSYALEQNKSSTTWQSFNNSLPNDNKDTSWFSLLNTGQVSLIRRLAIIDTAETSIDAQYFLWLEDAVGSLLFERLLAAADRGVRVRLLLDDSFLAGEDSVILALEEHQNIHVRIYNPFAIRGTNMAARYVENINDFSRTNHRMHNKLLIADSTVAIVGGRNIANEYFGFGKVRNFRDFDLLAAGKVVPELSNGFDLFWNSGWAFPVPEIVHKYASDTDLTQLKKDLRYKASHLDHWQEMYQMNSRTRQQSWQDTAKGMLSGDAKLLIDTPHFETKLPTQVSEHLLQALRASNEEIIAVSAYLIMTDELLNTTQLAIDNGVKVSFLTNSLSSTNHVAAHSAYRHHRKDLLRLGAKLYTVRSDAANREEHEVIGFYAEQFGLHSKVTILDKEKVFVGTLNLDPRSMLLNTEMGLLINSYELNAAVREAFIPDFSPQSSWQLQLTENDQLRWYSSDKVLTQQPAGDTGQRIMDFIYGLLPIDLEM